jgi:hypothetical protein
MVYSTLVTVTPPASDDDDDGNGNHGQDNYNVTIRQVYLRREPNREEGEDESDGVGAEEAQRVVPLLAAPTSAIVDSGTT